MSPSLPKTLAGLALASVLATGCEPPPVVPTQDHRQRTQLSRIEGEVVVTQTLARGNAIVLLYHASAPPPPQGTGRPVSFTVIPRERLFGSAGASAGGPFAAPFTFSQVAAGKYLLRGFIDTDACGGGSTSCRGSDFIPWYTVTGEPNAGDIGGAAVDALTLTSRVVEIAEKPEGVPLEPVTGVTVSFNGATSTVPLDRPAFWVEGDASTTRFDRTLGVRLTLKPLVLQRPPMDLRSPVFYVGYADLNRDGMPDDANGDGVPEVWPRVLVRKLAEGANLSAAQRLADENDLDRNGVLDDVDDQGNKRVDRAVVLFADLDASVYDALRASPAPVIPLTSLGIVVTNQAFDARNPSAPEPISLTSGRYALTLIHFTGQTWRVPNDLSQAVTLTDERAEKSQSFVIEVP